MPPEKVVNYAGQHAQFERSRCATGGGVFNLKKQAFQKKNLMEPQNFLGILQYKALRHIWSLNFIIGQRMKLLAIFAKC